MSLASLKRRSEALNAQVATAMQTDGKKSYDDEGFWKPFLDEEKGIGQAVIRFLPPVDDEQVPYVKYEDFGFSGPTNKWYIEKSLGTFGEPDPVTELFFALRNTKREDYKTLSMPFARRINYVTNILVLSDPGRPENEGQVFKYRMGPSIFKKLQEAGTPMFEGQVPIKPFDLWQGASFMLRAYRDGPRKKGIWKYDSSTWGPMGELYPGNDALKEAVLSMIQPLQPIIARSNFKSYEQLQQKLIAVLGPTIGDGFSVIQGRAPAQPSTTASEYNAPVAPVAQPAPAPTPAAPAPQATQQVPAGGSDEEDDDMAFFMNAAAKASAK